ncbi:MAG: SAM-dependent methyltransferase [Prevotellaceae bacterium]|jgi:16S rRNA (cytidine1402-2'-O)-methyltransferase|nr:SAM-dependent methyltransferase [Prevotellaceae bacterium]
MKGILYLIPTTLSDAPPERVMPSGNSAIVSGIRFFVVENIRTARRFLKLMNPETEIDTLTFFELNTHTPAEEKSVFLQPLHDGYDVGILSEAGCPAVADPGAEIVSMAQACGIRVAPLVGPSSILLALMGSGFNGQRFAFEGYLPIDRQARTSRLKQLEKRISSEQQTQIFIETPYRNRVLIEDMLRTLQPATKLCIAADLTADSQFLQTKTIAQWREHLPDVHKRPCIFLLYQ